MTFWTVNPDRDRSKFYHLTALPEACVGPPDRQFFMGGVALAATIEALEHAYEKPLLWTTIQFLSHGMEGDRIQIELDAVGGGRSVQQAAARIKTGDRVLQTAMAALGERPHHFDATFVKCPSVPAPLDCPEKPMDGFAQPGNLLDQFERRVAHQDDATGTEYLWFRPKFECEMSASLLALIADFFLGAHSQTQGGTSLDNTFRVHAIKPTEWVLNVVQLSSIKNGVAHGTVHQFSEQGELLSLGSQTGLLPRPK